MNNSVAATPARSKSPAPFRVGVVVLAAGASVRLGSPKQLLEIGGRPLVVRTAEAALASSAWPVVVVLGAHAERIRPVLARLPVLVTDNPAWPEGVASSVRAGVATLQQFSRQVDAALLAVCDQPAFTAEVISRLVGTMQTGGRSVTAARYGGHCGVPALFAREHFPRLLELTGEQGARSLLETENVAAVDLPELATDIDTSADFDAYCGRIGPAD